MPFYNSSSPTSSDKNSINTIAVDYGIRDFLLHKNLSPRYPFLSTTVNGSPKIGEPVLDTMVGTGNVTVPFGLPLETEGILRKDIVLEQNQFKSQHPVPAVSIVTTTKLPVYQSSTWPNGIQQYPTGSNPNVFQYGIMGKTVDGQYRKRTTLKNIYVDAPKQIDAADWITLEPMPTEQQLPSYLDSYGNLNRGDGKAVQASAIIGSVLNGQGLGFAKSGIVTNFDIRASLAGRVLSAGGLLNDTKLGVIGGQQLAYSLANNAAFNTQQRLLGSLNAQDNILSLVKNGTLAGFRPNYQITVPTGTGGRVIDTTARILGFTLPKSYLEDAGSIFASENGNAENISRANSMILNTGKGQVVALLTNVRANLAVNGLSGSTFRSGYAPAFANNRGEREITDSLLYAFSNGEGHLIDPLKASDGIIPDMSYLRDGKVDDSGFSDTGLGANYEKRGPFRPNEFTWTTTTRGGLTNTSLFNNGLKVGDRKSLLEKTQTLFNSVGMKTIVSTKGDMKINVPTQIQSGVNGGMSHGSAVLSSKSYDVNGITSSIKDATAADTFCRSWTTFDRYQKVKNQIRRGTPNDQASPNGLYSTVEGDGNLSAVSVAYRFNTEGSILDKYGRPQITPYTNDNKEDPKKYMFSIENLAWNDNVMNLLPCEVGPVDLATDKKGRIMWFPPYDIQFSENTSVNWEANQFIGRGENVYTYNNAERSGTLSFKIIVDHPSYVNSFRGDQGPDDNYIASFFAGCVDPTKNFSDKLTVSEINAIVASNVIEPQVKVVTPQVPPDNVQFYYPNDYSSVTGTISSGYEDGLSGATPADTINYTVYDGGFGIGNFVGGATSPSSWYDGYNYGLNGFRNPLEVGTVTYSGFTDPGYIPALRAYLDNECPACVVTITSFASAQGNPVYNQMLADGRSQSMYDYLYANLYTENSKYYKDKRFKILTNGIVSDSDCVAKATAPTDTFACKADRRTFVDFVFDVNLLPPAEIAPEPVIKAPVNKNVISQIRNRFYTECNYFDQLTNEDYFVFDKFRDKIKFFHPAFHSTTPEGLNSRLTFLNQCTRQGATLESKDANNLAFGRPPVCILRIGDFYNTKIIIDNLGIDYEPIVWDLNPEGIGVQPMIANVTLSFKFVGGSTLLGPINKLQNALSFNYYANSQVYDPRADYLSKNRPSFETVDETGVAKTVQATQTKSGYYINNGVVNLNPETNGVPSKAEVAINTPSVDQPAAADAAKTGAAAQQQPNVVKNDAGKVSLTKVTGGTAGIQLVFTVQTPLSKDYDCRVKIKDNASIDREIGVFRLVANTQFQAAEFTGTDVVSGLESGKSYFVTVTIGANQIKSSFTFS